MPQLHLSDPILVAYDSNHGSARLVKGQKLIKPGNSLVFTLDEENESYQLVTV
jgi:hypothetical protein